MINIYAQTFMHATHTGQIRVEDVPSIPNTRRHRWFTQRKTRLIAPTQL